MSWSDAIRSRSKIAVRVLASSGAYLRSMAVGMASDLFTSASAHATKRRVIDGYLVEGKRSGQVGSAMIMDFPALVLLGGTWQSPPIGILGASECPVAQLSRGRDSYLPSTITEVIDATASPLVTGVQPPGQLLLGSVGANTTVYRPFWGYTFRPFLGGSAVRTNGVFQSTNSTDPAAWVRPGQYVLYITTPFSLNNRRAIRTTENPSAVVAPATPSPPADVLLIISDSLIEAGTPGFSGMLKLPPDKDPRNVLLLSQCQAEWHTVCVSEFKEGAWYLWVVIHVTQLHDTTGHPSQISDTFGIRGLWIANVKITSTTTDDPPAATILKTYFINPLTNTGHRAVDVAYDYPQENGHRRSAPCMRSDGSAVVFDQFYTTRAVTDTDPFYTYVFLDVHVVSADFINTHNDVVTGTVPGDTTVGPNPSGLNIIGSDVDENDVCVCIVMGMPDSVGYTDPITTSTGCAIDVVVVDGNTVTKPLSAFLPSVNIYLPKYKTTRASGCASAVTSAYIQGRYTAFLFGGGGDKVTYIGNNKWAFYCGSTARNSVYGGTAEWYSDWAVAIYDRIENTVTLAGIIDPVVEITTQVLAAGRMDCVRPETEDHPATIIATRGDDSSELGYVDAGVNGGTWISYDSGATWTKMLDIGSASGVAHGGNVAQARTSPILRN